MRRYFVVALAVVAASACSKGSTSVAPKPSTVGPSLLSQAATPAPCCTSVESPNLKMRATPTTGGVGTLVRLRVTGCVDPSGRNHAVSYNNDAQNTNARNLPTTVKAIMSAQHGDRLDATYRIVIGDKTTGVGAFFAQCGNTVREAAFRVLG
jgi:hypothetical protein